MKLLIAILCWSLTGVAYAVPTLDRDQASRLIQSALAAEPLMWLPFPLPYEVDRTRQTRDSVLLDALYKHGLVTRESDVRMVDNVEGNRNRRVAQALWVYRYPDSRDAQTPEGFYYGRARLQRIVELSAPYRVGEYYYAEAFIQWSAVDLETWIQDPALRNNRTLRRSLESEVKPFERRVYLQHNGRSWGVWNGLPGG